MDQKIRGLLAYLFGFIGGLVILFAFNDNSKQTKFNAAQSITLSVIYIIIRILIAIIVGVITGIAIAAKIRIGFIASIISLFGWAINIGYITLAIIGMIKAYNEQDYELPLVANLTKKIFKSKLA